VTVSDYEPPSGLRTASPERTFGGGLSGRVLTDSEWTEIVDQTLNSVVKVEVETCSGSGSGSGFRVGNWIVTNKHVIEDATKVSIEVPSEEKAIDISQWYPAPDDDLAFLRLPTSRMPELTLVDSDAISGDLIALVGHPLGGEREVRRGRIFNVLDDMKEDSKTFVFSVTAEALPGDSGGPAINTEGKVMGVTYAIDLLESRSLVIPASRISALLDSKLKPKEPDICDAKG
jgi:S1-C subfamily serine protease